MQKQNEIMLSSAKLNKNYLITNFNKVSLMDKRLEDLGFVRGTKVKVVAKSLFDLTIAVCIRNATICIRKQNADSIFVREI